MKADTEEGAISGMTIIKAKDRTTLMTEMAKGGYNYVVNESLNYNAGGDPIYLAYKMCSPDAMEQAASENSGGFSLFDDEEDEDWSGFNMDFSNVVPTEKTIHDIICVSGGTPEPTITHNGVQYELVSDISLNSGTAGRALYLYQTMEDTVTVNGRQVKLAPLSQVAMCSGNAVPSKDQMTNDYGTWEEMLDTQSHVVDVNDGVFARIDDGKHVRSCRVYLFVHRYDQSVKPGAEIKRGEGKDTFTYGNLYIKG